MKSDEAVLQNLGDLNKNSAEEDIVKKLYINPWGGIISAKYSISAITFMQHIELLEYLLFYLMASDRIISKNYNEYANESLEYIKSIGPKFDETLNLVIDRKAGHILLRAGTYEYLLANMAHCKSVDEFILYLKNILAEIIQIKPQILKSGDTEKLDFILNFDDINSLRIALAEKKIEKLFYGSFNDVYTFYKSRIGVELVCDQVDIERINLLIKVRNLLVHNGGKGNTAFKSEFPNYPFGVGEEVRFKFLEVLENNRFIIEIVQSLDVKITEKFGLSLMTIEDLRKSNST